MAFDYEDTEVLRPCDALETAIQNQSRPAGIIICYSTPEPAIISSIVSRISNLDRTLPACCIVGLPTFACDDDSAEGMGEGAEETLMRISSQSQLYAGLQQEAAGAQTSFSPCRPSRLSPLEVRYMGGTREMEEGGGGWRYRRPVWVSSSNVAARRPQPCLPCSRRPIPAPRLGSPGRKLFPPFWRASKASSPYAITRRMTRKTQTVDGVEWHPAGASSLPQAGLTRRLSHRDGG